MYKSLIVAVALLAFGCSKSDDDKAGGGSSPIPSAVDIVKASLPDSLESVAVSSARRNTIDALSVDSNLSELKSRLFSPGPTDFLYRLKSVDDRLDSLADAIVECADTTANTFTPPTVATSFSFPMSLACVQNIDASANGISDYKVYFGKSGGFWYVADIQTNAGFSSEDGEPPTMAVLAKIAESGETAEIYQISVERKSGTDYANVMHIKADRANSIFEVSTASSADSTQTLQPGANMSGVGCGVSMKTNGSLIYASGSFSQATSCPSTATVCADATLQTTTGCTGVVDSSSTLTLNRAAVSANASNAKSLVVDRTWLSGLN